MGFVLLVFMCNAMVKAQDTVTIKTNAGPVVGEVSDGIRVFKGIPYAAPPVGDLRWRAPQAVAPWQSPRQCQNFSSRCPQPDVSDRPWLGKAGPMDEDCLYLNVWAPSDVKKPLPVMVWIHGGGFTIGAGSLDFYEGKAFAKEQVVLVTINYRLGPFGFFGHEALAKESPNHVSGNYGLLDQIAALQWVQRNIQSFGGDPNCVTIFGESAGSVAVTCLMVSPLAKGLFHRAIAQSGTGTSIYQQLNEPHKRSKSLHATGNVLADKLGIDASDTDALAKLRNVSAQKLLEISNPQLISQGLQGTKFGPVIDGYVLPANPGKMFANGQQHPIPLMIGSNQQDGILHASALPIRRVQGYKWILNRLFGKDGPAVFDLFPAKTNDDIKQAKLDLMTVSAFAAPSRRLAAAMQNVATPAYLYEFTRISPAAKRKGLGAVHGAEIVYLFDTFGHPTGYDQTDHQLANQMRTYWINFATTGNPNGSNLPHWPTYDVTDQHMQFGDTSQAGKHLYKQACDIFDRVVIQEQ